MKFDALHWVQVALMVISAGAAGVSQVEAVGSPLAHACALIVAASVGMLGALGLVSHSVMGTTVPNPPAKLLPQSSSGTIVVLP